MDSMTSPRFPEPPASIPATQLADVDVLLEKLSARKDAWARLSIPDRIGYLHAIQEGVLSVAESWVDAGCRAKGIAAGSPLGGEEWLSGPMTVVRNIRLLIEALEAQGQPKAPALEKRPDGQWVARVFPATALDKLMFAGFTGELWIEPGKEPTQGRIYREKSTKGGVGLVLGAGNISSIGPMDALHKLFVENEVVIIKMNPVNEYVGPFLAQGFKALVDAGFFGVVYGGAEVGAHLTRHALVDSIHITGSDRTHDAIVWGGTPEEQQKNKAAGTPVCTKPITSELGAVTPVFIIPGPWSDDDLRFQARHVASMVVHNGSFNCNAAKVLVTARGWPQRQKFLDLVHQNLGGIPSRKAYYPGARQRFEGFLKNYPNANKLQPDSAEVVPWTVLPDVPLRKGEFALSTEAFCGVLAETVVEATDAVEFMKLAAPAANEHIWGTLSCMMLVHPQKQKQHAAALDSFIAELKYGGIGVNVWAGVIYGLVTTSWGAFPGHTMEEIVSGKGAVHNTYLFDHPQKSVVRAPFRIAPTPAWFASHKTLDSLGRKLTFFEAAPSFLKLPGVLASALRG